MNNPIGSTFSMRAERLSRSSLRHLLLASTFACAIATSQTQAAAEDRFASVEIKAQAVAGSVYMLEGAGGNIGVSIGEDGTLIIDDQFAPLGDKIIAALNELGGDLPKLVLNTHFHGDHTGSNPQMGKSGTIIAHDNVRIRLLNNEDFPRSGLPLVTYAESISVHFNDDELAVIHLPTGHTDGDSVIWFKQAGVVHMGDHFFNGRFPFVDINSGGSVDGFVRNVERVIAMVPADTKVIPGHGPLASIEDLANAIAVTKESSALVRESLASGTSAEDLAETLDERYPGWGSGFINAERWVQIIQADANN